MTIKVGSQDVQAIYVGSTPVQEVYVGSTKIWPVTWHRWSRTASGITDYVFTLMRNPQVGDRAYIETASGYEYSANITMVSVGTPVTSVTVQQYTYTYDGVAS